MAFYFVEFKSGAQAFAWGENATDAINAARESVDGPMQRLGLPRIDLGSATARKAMYGEWDCNPKHITIDGNHDHTNR